MTLLKMTENSSSSVNSGNFSHKNLNSFRSEKVKGGRKVKEKDINYLFFFGLMDIDLTPYDKLNPLRKSE